jgi:hypothetical protein
MLNLRLTQLTKPELDKPLLGIEIELGEFIINLKKQ